MILRRVVNLTQAEKQSLKTFIEKEGKQNVLTAVHSLKPGKVNLK